MSDDAVPLREYIEKRFDLLADESNFRHAAAEKQVSAALAASKEAISKAEAATNARFEAGNEIRNAMIDRERMFIPRAEVEAREAAMGTRVAALEKRQDANAAERAGIKGGYGYAVGVVGFVLAIVSVVVMLMKATGNG